MQFFLVETTDIMLVSGSIFSISHEVDMTTMAWLLITCTQWTVRALSLYSMFDGSRQGWGASKSPQYAVITNFVPKNLQ